MLKPKRVIEQQHFKNDLNQILYFLGCPYWTAFLIQKWRDLI